MPLLSARGIQRLILVSILLVGSLCIVARAFLPQVVGFAWRIVHGPIVTYGNRQVRVPDGWFAYHHSDQVLLIERLPAWVSREAEPGGHVGISRPLEGLKPFSLGADCQRVKAMWTREAEKEGFVFSRERTINVNGRALYCLDFTGRHAVGRARVSCMVDNDTWLLDYAGGTKYLNNFYAIVDQLLI